MGCGASYEFVPKEGVPGQDPAAFEVLRKLRLSQDHINKFYTAFVDIDANFCGFVRVDEFRDYFDVAFTPFNQKLFGVFSSWDRGHLNFMEFVCTLWSVLSRDRNLIPAFVFSLNCDPNNQTLDPVQLDTAVRSIHGDKFKTVKGGGLHKVIVNATRAMTKTNPPKLMNINEFNDLVRQHPVVIGPVLHTLFKMKKTLLGEDFWEKMTRNRQSSPDMCDSNYVLKISGGYVPTERVVQESISRTVNKPPKRRKSVLDTLKDTVRGSSSVQPESPADSPSLVLPNHKRHRKSVFKPNLTVP